jgi:hypothetical protein
MSSFTSLVSSTLGLSLHTSSVLMKSQYIIIYCNKTFKTILEVQILLQHLYNILQSAHRIVNGEHYDIIHILYQGIFHFQKVTQFHSICVYLTLWYYKSCHNVHYNSQDAKHWPLPTANYSHIIYNTVKM